MGALGEACRERIRTDGVTARGTYRFKTPNCRRGRRPRQRPDAETDRRRSLRSAAAPGAKPFEGYRVRNDERDDGRGNAAGAKTAKAFPRRGCGRKADGTGRAGRRTAFLMRRTRHSLRSFARSAAKRRSTASESSLAASRRESSAARSSSVRTSALMPARTVITMAKLGTVNPVRVSGASGALDTSTSPAIPKTRPRPTPPKPSTV